MRQRSAVLCRAYGAVVALVLAPLSGCNERFDFDVPPPDAGEDGGTTTGGDVSDTGQVDTDVSTETATSTTGGEPDASTGCTADADCRLATLHCHLALGRCVECLDDQDCSGGDRTHCDAELSRCVSCTQDDQCEEGSRCDALERSCAVSCTSQLDCVDAHACMNGLCVACDRDFECRENDALGQVCSASGLNCVSCREDAQCPSPEVCDILSGRCVACLTSEGCGDGAVCDPVLLQCVN